MAITACLSGVTLIFYLNLKSPIHLVKGPPLIISFIEFGTSCALLTILSSFIYNPHLIILVFSSWDALNAL
jgi:hypothetical protein